MIGTVAIVFFATIVVVLVTIWAYCDNKRHNMDQYGLQQGRRTLATSIDNE